MRRCVVGERSASNSAFDGIPLWRRVGRPEEQRSLRAFRRGTRPRDRCRAQGRRTRRARRCHQIMAACSRQSSGRVIGREQRADAAGERDARPPGSCRQRERRARQRKAAIGEFDRRDRAPASPSPRAGRKTDRCAARPARRRAPTRRFRRSSGSARTASRAAGLRSGATLKMPSPCAVATRAKSFRPKRARIRRDGSRRTARAYAGRGAGSGPCASWCATGRARGRC